MKYFRNILMLIALIAVTSCGDDDYLEIDSLSADGNEFYCNQKVKVWMCVNSSDLWHTTYSWTCEGGSFTQPQGLNEETWKAPNVPGVYTITCTAKVGDVTQTRTRKMYVSSYYFEKFEKTLHSFTLQGTSKNSLKKESDGNQYLQIQVNQADQYQRYVRRAFDDTELHTPFSTRMKLGFEKNMPNTQMITAGGSSGRGMLEYRWNMRNAAENNGKYISQIRLLWYPGAVTDGLPLVAESDAMNQTQTVEGTEDYNVIVAVQYTDANNKKTTYYEYHKLDTFNTFKNKLYQTVSMGVDSDNQLTAYVAGNLALTSRLIADVRTANNCEGNLYINNWEFYYLNGNQAKNVPVMYIDDAYASNTEILF
ncbi:hypothetical protein [uncultured Duncaniella sp.]|uniref:hypothetical protein n=1 Tax=uncultured Duncaniella sp. TaxID=2768039 RepID=UPI002619CC08|nr:hypothetical protein [uncultured Duncaniella sp.]